MDDGHRGGVQVGDRHRDGSQQPARGATGAQRPDDGQPGMLGLPAQHGDRVTGHQPGFDAQRRVTAAQACADFLEQRLADHSRGAVHVLG